MAKISRGRTLGEFILGTLLIPSLYSFIWLGTFGSEGIRMDRRAESEGLDCGAWDGNPDSIFSNTTNAVRWGSYYRTGVGARPLPTCMLRTYLHRCGYGA